ncbi:hypothetical protein [Silvimonas iriomotensis]|uniref:Porin n=1 Tax=Silvimonas iriomotensis TaxID=449662 RepID=A0ABQ2P504_9NEIS|nr:hypothetical protein [Silvimonas iriomotensis]GGP18507.1 hypothetical protein GCM10010970_05330 [Silvimonas iriomotensis]
MPTLTPLRFAVLLAAALSAAAARADTLLLDAGFMNSPAQDDHSYAWSLIYNHPFTANWSASFSWINEGHVEDHHRDGHSFQLWYNTDPFWGRVKLAAGIGPYRYFDTTTASTSNNYDDNHGWGVIYSLAAIYQNPDSNWQYQLRYNHIDARGSIDTNSVTLGLGYELAPDTRSSGANWRAGNGNQEVTAYYGRTILNSFDSETGTAGSLEYRYSLSPWVKLSGAWLLENNNATVRHNGALAEVWLEPEFFNKRFTIGVGGGAYFLLDKKDNVIDGRDADPSRVSGVVTLTSSYRLGQDWRARVAWHRIVTSYSRDSDIILLGAGYQF